MFKRLLIFYFILSSIVGLAQIDNLVFKLQILPVKDVETNDTLTDVKVNIVGTDGSSREFMSDSLGEFQWIDLKPKTSYSTVISKKGYLNAKGKETSVGFTESRRFIHEYALQALLICRLPPPITAPVYEFNQSDLKGAKCENNATNYIINILTENPTIVVLLNGYRDSTENVTISRERAVNFRLNLIKLGIEGDRIKLKDAGIREIPNDFQWHDDSDINLCNPKRVVLMQVLSTDYTPKK